MPKVVKLDQDVYSLAIERAHHAFDMFDTIAVAFSGGKDSTAVLNIALDVAHERGEQLPLQIIHYDEEVETSETHDYVQRVCDRDDVEMRWYCLPMPHQNACSREHGTWWPWDPEHPELWVRDLPSAGIVPAHEVYTSRPHASVADWYPLYPVDARWSSFDLTGAIFPPDRFGSVGLLLGIRAAESLTRFQSVTAKRHDNYIVSHVSNQGLGAHEHAIPAPDAGNVWKVYPVYDWATEDVWNAPHLRGWDYNHTYDLMRLHGISIHQQRVAPPFSPEALASLDYFAACFPELWDKMGDRAPGVAAAQRYAKTELYNYGKARYTKADHLTWEEFIRELLLRLQGETRARMAQRVSIEIARHHRMTTDPILERTAHPDTGLSWNFLYMIVSRADVLGRKLVRNNAARTPKDYVRMKKQWDAEFDEMVADGRLDPKRRSGDVKVSGDHMLDTVEDDGSRVGGA